MPKIEGKTINELIRVSDITGAEIIPMSVYSEEMGAYVTRGITLDDFFKTIYGMIQHAEDGLAYTNAYMNSYVSELREVDESLHERDNELNSQIAKTNTYVAYNAEGIVKLHNDFHDVVSDVVSYAYTEVAYVNEKVGEITSYVTEEIGGIHTDVEGLARHDVILTSYIEDNRESISETNERLDEEVAYSHTEVAYLYKKIGYTQLYIESELATAYNTLDDSIAYLAAYIEAGDGRIAYELEQFKSYAYAGIGELSYSQTGQDITLAQHAQAIQSLARASSYNAYVNTIQSGHINTIYFENSNDAFNDWSNPYDDNVKPQQ